MAQERLSNVRKPRSCASGRRNPWPGRRTVVLLIGTLGMLATDAGYAADRAPNVLERVWASQGDSDPDYMLWEPAVAAGSDLVLTVFTVGDGLAGDDEEVWYSVCDASDPNSVEWVTEGVIPLGDYFNTWDPSVAYDSQTGGFLAAAYGTGEDQPTNKKHLLTARFHPETDPNDPNYPGYFDAWESQYGYVSAWAVDKPWIVAGDPNVVIGQENYQEFYVVWYADAPAPAHYRYLRSIDGGDSWCGGRVFLNNDANQPVTADFCAQPAVYEDGKLYIAYVPETEDPSIEFLVGTDIDPNDPNDPNDYACNDPNDPNQTDAMGVEFDRLYGASLLRGPQQRVPLSLPLNYVEFSSHLPGGMAAKTVPCLVTDPTNSNRLFVAYHDTATDDPNDHDVNVYLQKLTKTGGDWRASSRIEVNNDVDPDGENDQFLPSLTVDDEGYVSVLFYDDRDFDQEDGAPDPNDPNAPQPKFDAYFAWALVTSLSFTSQDRNVRLFLDSSDPDDPPALDWTDVQLNPREYNGITWYGDSVWTTYAGTDATDQVGNASVIWSSRVDWVSSP